MKPTASPEEASPAGSASSSTDSASEFLQQTTVLDKFRKVLHRYPAVSPSLVLIAAIVFFGLINDRIWAPANLSLISQQVAVIGIVAIAQTLIILTAGIDLSVGAIMVLSSMVMAKTAVDQGVPVIVAMMLGLIVALAAGALNGFLVSRFALPPFIVTLGTLSIFSALMLLYSNTKTVRGADLPGFLTATGKTFPIGGVQVSYGVVLMLVLYVLVAYALGRTAWGRHVYAVGDDSGAARLAGVRVTRVIVSVYLAGAAILALAAWVQIGRSFAASPNAGQDINLDSITAVVIGGTSLFGGRGVIWGSLIGALIVGVLRNGLALVGVDNLYQSLAVGVLVIVAVMLDQWIRKVRK